MKTLTSTPKWDILTQVIAIGAKITLEMNQSIERSKSGWSNLLKGCALLAVLAVVGIIVLLIYLMRMPAMKSIMDCRTNIVAVGEAIGRYHDATGNYPSDLHAIEKDYLANRSVLRCPLDKSNSEESSYKYHRPLANSGGRFIMLECGRHSLGKDMPISRLIFLKNGTVDMENPDMKKILENERKKTSGTH